MNKLMSKLWLLMAFALVIPAFTSCGDDDDDKTTDYATKVTGTYNGNMNVTMGGQSIQTIPNSSIVVSRTDVNATTLKFNQTITINGGAQLPLDVTCPATASDNGDGKTKLTGSTEVTFNPAVEIPQMGSVSKLQINIDGTVDASGNAVLDIKAMAGLITVKFTGKK